MKIYISTWIRPGMRGVLSFQNTKPCYVDGDYIPLREIEIDDDLVPTKDEVEAAIIAATADSKERRLAKLKSEQARIEQELLELTQ